MTRFCSSPPAPVYINIASHKVLRWYAIFCILGYIMKTQYRGRIRSENVWFPIISVLTFFGRVFCNHYHVHSSARSIIDMYTRICAEMILFMTEIEYMANRIFFYINGVGARSTSTWLTPYSLSPAHIKFTQSRNREKGQYLYMGKGSETNTFVR